MFIRGFCGHVRRHAIAYVALFFAMSGTALAGSSYITKSEKIASGDLVGSTYGDPLIAKGKVTNAKLAHSSLSMNAGTGLTGGGSVALGSSRTLSLANGYQLPQSCSSGQVAKSDGSGAWNCAADDNSGGTVTSVGSGTGLTGGPITTSGTLSLASGYQLPQSCSSGQVPQSDGSGGWGCGTPTNMTQMMGGSIGTISGTGELAMAPVGLSTPSTTLTSVEAGTSAVASTAANLTVQLSAAPGTGSTWNFTFVVNGKGSGYECEISGIATSCMNTSQTLSIPAGSTVGLIAAPFNGTPAAARVTFGWTDSS